ncbi:hypothetical protein [Mesonia sp.]|uniref:hypothetical protein n=1 Tax=Mesonia sp. TaxID=1960830 RepID=UPI003F9DB575
MNTNLKLKMHSFAFLGLLKLRDRHFLENRTWRNFFCGVKEERHKSRWLKQRVAIRKGRSGQTHCYEGNELKT